MSSLHVLNRQEAEAVILSLEGLTCRDIGERMGISRQTVWNLLNGRAGMGWARRGAIEKLKEVLGNDEE